MATIIIPMRFLSMNYWRCLYRCRATLFYYASDNPLTKVFSCLKYDHAPSRSQRIYRSYYRKTFHCQVKPCLRQSLLSLQYLTFNFLCSESINKGRANFNLWSKNISYSGSKNQNTFNAIQPEWNKVIKVRGLKKKKKTGSGISLKGTVEIR